MTRNTALAALLSICLAAAIFPLEKKNAEEEKLRMVQGAVIDAQENPVVKPWYSLRTAKPFRFVLSSRRTKACTSSMASIRMSITPSKRSPRPA